jgi:alkylation response protein AidB-like acyl-CoA dehydrogenase
MNDTAALDHEDSETQRMLRDAVRAYARDRWPWQRLFDLERRDATLPSDELERVHEMGWLAMLVPERLGGAGISLLDAAVVFEELGFGGVAVLPVGVANVAAQVLASANSEALDEMVRRQAAQKAFYTLSEAQRWSGAAREASVATVDGDGLLQANLHMVPWAHLAEGVVLPVKIGGNAAVAVVPLRQAHVHVSGTMDAPLYFSVRIAGVPLASIPHAAADVGVLADALITALAVPQMAGLMSRIARITAEYIGTRVVFGRPVSSFQAARHRATDILSLAELTRSTAYQAIWNYQEAGDLASVWRAKQFANAAVDRVTQNAHLLHGGIGVNSQYPLHTMTLALMALAVKAGTTPELVERVDAGRSLQVP